MRMCGGGFVQQFFCFRHLVCGNEAFGQADPRLCKPRAVRIVEHLSQFYRAPQVWFGGGALPGSRQRLAEQALRTRFPVGEIFRLRRRQNLIKQMLRRRDGIAVTTIPQRNVSQRQRREDQWLRQISAVCGPIALRRLQFGLGMLAVSGEVGQFGCGNPAHAVLH